MIGKPAQFQKLSNYLPLKNLCQRGCVQTPSSGRNPVGVDKTLANLPRVGAWRQPWALSRNAVGGQRLPAQHCPEIRDEPWFPSHAESVGGTRARSTQKA